jgi:hypothetical protein
MGEVEAGLRRAWSSPCSGLFAIDADMRSYDFQTHDCNGSTARASRAPQAPPRCAATRIFGPNAGGVEPPGSPRRQLMTGGRLYSALPTVIGARVEQREVDIVPNGG